jgi:hypothetical protein
MGQLIIHHENGRLELDGLLLQRGDQVEILHLGTWLLGTIAHDQEGWYLLINGNAAGESTSVRLQTGQMACLATLA